MEAKEIALNILLSNDINIKYVYISALILCIRYTYLFIYTIGKIH